VDQYRSSRFRRYLAFFLFPLAFGLFTACPQPPDSEERDTTIFLATEQVGIFSVRLRVSVADTIGAWRFGLTRDDSLVLTATVTGADTVVRDAGLRPGHTYRYRAYWLKNSDFADSSALLTLTTMDTTSHNFTWVIDTLGNYGSYLNDVAIIDENNIWVVGNIETDSGEFNAAKWDGFRWKTFGIYSNTLDLYSIQYFSDDDIWVTIGMVKIGHCTTFKTWDWTPALEMTFGVLLRMTSILSE
jgi:hypothetical protein